MYKYNEYETQKRAIEAILEKDNHFYGSWYLVLGEEPNHEAKPYIDKMLEMLRNIRGMTENHRNFDWRKSQIQKLLYEYLMFKSQFELARQQYSLVPLPSLQ